VTVAVPDGVRTPVTSPAALATLEGRDRKSLKKILINSPFLARIPHTVTNV